MATKSPDAFRTISEVADWLGVEAHVLRFWETKFSQVKPVKRAGGRRYYRPSDMALLGGIQKLLHEDGVTIRGVQKILREQGVGHVTELAPKLDLGAGDGHPKPAREHARSPQTREDTVLEPPMSKPPVHDDHPVLPFDLPEMAPEVIESVETATIPAVQIVPEPVLADSVAPETAHGSDSHPVAYAPSVGKKADISQIAALLERARRLVRQLQDIPE